MKKLVVDGLSCRRGERLVFEDVSFEAASGEAVLLTGPNGVGKTTLLRTIAGLLKPTTGAVRVEGLPEPDTGIGPSIHFVGPLDAIKPTLTVDENLQFWQRYLASGDGHRADRTTHESRRQNACNTLGLGNLTDIPAGFLSTGQRRRLALVRLLVVDRPLWLLDEPTLGLDAASSTALADMITRHVKNDGIVLVATHADLGLDAIAGKVRTMRFDASEPVA